MAAGIIGSVGEFNPDQESVSAYLERVDLYFKANHIGEDMQVPSFLSIVGRETYRRLSDLYAPDKPAAQSMEALKDKLTEYYEPLKIDMHRRAV